MDEFIKKWKTDKKFKALVQLIIYSLFVVIISIYAVSSSKNIPLEQEKDTTNSNQTITEEKDNIIAIPKTYNYTATVTVDENEYIFKGEVLNNREKIEKTVDNKTTTYIYENEKYYIEESDGYILTTKEEVYGNINKSYFDLNSINNYLKHGQKEGNQYIVYLKDIVLNNDSNEYIVILISNNTVNVDYTPLIKIFNSEITTYNVKVQYEEIK